MANDNIYGLRKQPGKISVDKGISGRNIGSSAVSYPIGKMIKDPNERPELKEDSVDDVDLNDLSNEVIDANQEVLKKHGYFSKKKLGEGNFGVAFELPNNKVIKITTDKQEAHASMSIKGKKLEYIVNIFDVFKLKHKFEVYGIVQEKLSEPPNHEELDLNELLIETYNQTGKLARDLCKGRSWTEFVREAYRLKKEKIKNLDSSEQKKESDEFAKLLKDFKELKFDEMLNELVKVGIKFGDFHAGNFMFKNGHLAIIDLGHKSVVANAGVPPVLEGVKPEDIGYNAEGYKLHDRYVFQGLPIAVENKAGTYREWGDKPEQKTFMSFDYGYVEGVNGTDGDEVDVYVGPDEAAEFVYVVHQNKVPDFKEFDEDKCMIGFASEEAAKRAYLAHYDNPKFYGGMSAMPTEKFKEKLLCMTQVGAKKITNEIYKMIKEHLMREADEIGPVKDPSNAKKVLKKFSDSLKNKKGIKTGLFSAKILGSGTQGTTFDIGGGKVLKITNDKKEAVASNKILNKSLQNVVKVFDVFRFKDTEIYGIVLEKLEPMAQNHKENFNKLILSTNIRHHLQVYKEWDTTKQEVVKQFDNEQDKQRFLKYMDYLEQYNVKNIYDELKQNGVRFFDFNGDNLMKRGNDYVITDIGYSKTEGGTEPAVFEDIKEDLKAAGKDNVFKTLKANTDSLKSKKQIDASNPHELGSGQKGVAYAIGGNLVLKITTDETEARASMLLKGKNTQNIVKIFDVFQFKKNLSPIPLYGIKQEKLTPLSDAEKGEFSKAIGYVRDHEQLLNALATQTWEQFEKLLFEQIEKDVENEIDIPSSSPSFESKVKKASTKKYNLITSLLQKFEIKEMSDELKRNGIHFADYHSGNLMKRGSKYIINDLGASKSGGPDPELFEGLDLENFIEGILVKLTKENPLSSFAQTGLYAQSSQWSRPSLLDPKKHDEIEELQNITVEQMEQK